MDHSLFLTPFLTGLCFALLLPLLGCYLHLREERLAALAYANVAAAGALGAMALNLPLVMGGLLAAAAAALLKRGLRGRLVQGTVYALLLLLGWAMAILLTANLPMAERIGHALFDGQLYFTGLGHLALAALGLLLGAIALRVLSRHLLLAQLFPQIAHSRGCAGRHELAFDLLVALVLALATMVIGVMAAFALVFIPAWVAFARARKWRSGLVWASVFGTTTYLAAFAAALWLDQPFGPLFTVCMVIFGCALVLFGRNCTSAPNMLKV